MDKKEIEEMVKNKADLYGVDLRGADLYGADLHRADLRRTDLYGVDLRRANLCGADLREANLCGVDLRRADLRRADLYGVDLRRANLCGADLRRTDLYGADLRDTCLDPDNIPNSPIEMKSGIGYRTRQAGHIDKYRDGRVYSADWFSTCPDTECHPGLYLWPTLEEAIKFSGESKEFIKVETSQADCHKVGTKYRTRWFKVIGTV